jgi:hypothetical protein
MNPAKLIQVADAVVAELVAGQGETPPAFSLPFETVRRSAPITDLQQLKDLHVTVIGAGWSKERATRGSVLWEFAIHVGLQKKLTSEENAEIDPLVALLDEIDGFFDREPHRRPHALPDAFFVGSEAAAVPLDDEEMRTKRIYTGVTVLRFQLYA